MPDHKDLSLLVDAARESGAIALRHFGNGPDTWEKTGNAGPVTEADIEIDRMLSASLQTSRPSYGWLSEESEDTSDRLERERVFIIDPIDGTRAFIAGEKHFSHSLAIAENGVVVAAAVYLPVMDLMFTASHDSQAMLNGEPIRVSRTSKLDGATVLAAKSNLHANHWRNGVPPLVRKFRPSLAYRLCLVAEGAYDAMLTLRECWEWDIAAGDLIVRQAGGAVTDKVNQPLRFNNRLPKTNGCLAAGRIIHKEVHSHLAEI